MRIISTFFEAVSWPALALTDRLSDMAGMKPTDRLSYQLQTDPDIFGNSYFRGKQKPSTDRRIEPGMILRVNRTGYRHYGVYVGNKSVIHYTSDDGDTSSDNRIRETSLAWFLGPSDVVQVIAFPDEVDGKPILSREKAVANARSRLGEGGYNVRTNNCQHFAIWCRTGIKFSGQSYYFDGGQASAGNVPLRLPDFLEKKGMSVYRTILALQVIAG